MRLAGFGEVTAVTIQREVGQRRGGGAGEEVPERAWGPRRGGWGGEVEGAHGATTEERETRGGQTLP